MSRHQSASLNTVLEMKLAHSCSKQGLCKKLKFDYGSIRDPDLPRFKKSYSAIGRGI